ncbi:MAG TPA: DUF1189 family protein [Elusimicrobiota bacterium]|nr:DUF1189 family protein [Elusimicrobiota bacterium]
MIPDLLDSIVRPGAYKRFAAEKGARTVRYAAFLSLIFVGAIGISVKIRLAPMFTETFDWLETAMPPLTFAAGGATSTTPGPLRVQHPKIADVAVMIDTGRKDPVTAEQMKEAKVIAYLTGNALYLDRGQGQLETIDLTKSAPEHPVTVDATMYKEMERTFDWVFYPALMLFFFLAFAVALAFCALLYGLAGLVLASLAGGALEYAALFRIGLHAQTAGSLLYALDATLPVSIPFFQLISVALSLTFLWLGVKAAVKAAPAAEPPAPAA